MSRPLTDPRVSSLGRREFLRATLISAAGLLGACKPGGSDDGDGETGGTGTSDSGTETGEEPPEVVDGFEFFPQSVASGDPRPGSVILWTRVADSDLGDADVELELELSLTEDFEAPMLEPTPILAATKFDRCAKVRLTELPAGEWFYYRFVYTKDGIRYGSRIGRSKPAPEPNADVGVRFAFLSCQDFSRWYNVLTLLAADEFDFVVHLGDYIYETTADPDFQIGNPDRSFSFDDPDGAIVFNEGESSEYYAAASLSNYRQLYKVYRGDRALQTVHEQAPMIVIWDDHEYSNDCHGATATYFGGRVDEDDVTRRKHANQAWFEYMPVDYLDAPEFEYDPTANFPGDLVIYRDFVYGQHLHLVMTDERTWRTDHPIREDAFPGTVVVDEATVLAELGELPVWARPYLDIDAWDGGSVRDALIAAAPDVGFDPAWITGDLDALVVNDLITTIDPNAMSLTPLDQATLDGLPRGVSYASMGKNEFYASFGARLFVVKPAYDLWTRLRFEDQPALEHVLGDTQQAWLVDTINASTQTWKVWGNEYLVGQMAVDLRGLAPAPFNNLYYLSLDLWDGHRNRREQVLSQIGAVPNLVAITGDIHGFYATVPQSTEDPSLQLREFVGSSVTSSSFKEILEITVATNPILANFAEAPLLVEALDSLLASGSLKTNPHMAYVQSDLHGYVMIELDGEHLDATYHQLTRNFVQNDYTDNLSALVSADSIERFRVNLDDPDLYRDFNGEWRRWDRTTQTWV